MSHQFRRRNRLDRHCLQYPAEIIISIKASRLSSAIQNLPLTATPTTMQRRHGSERTTSHKHIDKRMMTRRRWCIAEAITSYASSYRHGPEKKGSASRLTQQPPPTWPTILAFCQLTRYSAAQPESKQGNIPSHQRYKMTYSTLTCQPTTVTK